MKTKERVKKGELTAHEAMYLVSPDCKTYGWLKRRQEKKGK